MSEKEIMLVTSIFSFSDSFNFLPNNKILDWTKFKAFADNKINVTKNFRFAFDRVENWGGKGENAGNHHFLLFSHFQEGSSSGSKKPWIVLFQGC